MKQKVRGIMVRITKELDARLQIVLAHPYAPSQSKIIERGIELALDELEKLQKIGKKSRD